MNGFLEKYFHKMIFQITRYYDEPNRVLALFFSPFILFLSVMLFSILLVHWSQTFMNIPFFQRQNCGKMLWTFLNFLLSLTAPNLASTNPKCKWQMDNE